MKLFLAALALALMAVPAFAQISASSANNNANTSSTQSQSSVAGSPIGNGSSSTTANNTANVRAASQSSAQNGIAAARTGNSNAAITINNGPSDPSGAAAGDPTSTNNINYSGGYTLRNVPEVIAPNVVGGNPCAVGISGGLAVSGFGITGGGTWADRQCERRQEAALLFNIGQKQAAVALLCQDDHVRDAIIASGATCPGGAPQAVATVAAPAAPQPWLPQVTMQPAPQPVVPVAVAPPPVPDWCTAVTGRAEQVKYQTECHFVLADDTRRKAIAHHR